MKWGCFPIEKRKRFDTFVIGDILISNMNSILTSKSNEKLGKASVANVVVVSEQLWHPCYQTFNIKGEFDSMNRSLSGD